MKPRIAIPAPTSTDLAYNQRAWPQYAACVERAGGEPVRLDPTLPATELKTLAASCDGVLLPGSPADVDPALYGEERLPECAVADSLREAIDILLLEDACDRRSKRPHPKPVLAICYGLQSLNTWRGGSLVQDVAPLPVNHAAGGSVAIAHTAMIAEGSALASLLTSAEAPASDGFLRLPVNSSHHQAVASPGEGLRIVARCPEDGVIEAVEIDPAFPPIGLLPSAFSPIESASPGAIANALFHVEHAAPQFLLGVQWHPERSYDLSAASRALFDHLIAEASSFAQSARHVDPPASSLVEHT